MADRASEDTPPILIVEDDPVLRQSIAWALEDDGLIVETASDGRRALEQIARRAPALVLLDMRLPIVTGEGVAAGLRQTHGDGVPIVVITADGHAREKAARVGVVDYLNKPFELEHLIATVRRALAS